MRNVISSANNEIVKRIRKLSSSAKERRTSGFAIAEGIHLARSLLSSRIDPSLYVISAAALDNVEIAEISNLLQKAGAKEVILSDTLFASVTSIHPNVGILIMFPTPGSIMHHDSLKRNSVLLENIQDPGNLGTILRTTVAVGIQDVYLSSGCASPWSPKSLKGGMGAQFKVNLFEGVNLLDIIERSSIPVYGTTLANTSSSLFNIHLEKDVGWVFGNEGQGISPELVSICKETLTIPQAESTVVESLNVASAVAVCLYEQFRQNLH